MLLVRQLQHGFTKNAKVSPNLTVTHFSAIHGCCLSYGNPGYLYPGPYAVRTKSQLNKQAKHTIFYKFEEGISFAEHWKLVAESPEFHLTLERAHRVHVFQL